MSTAQVAVPLRRCSSIARADVWSSAEVGSSSSNASGEFASVRARATRLALLGPKGSLPLDPGAWQAHTLKECGNSRQ
jgi:hypothetical protein